MADAAAFAAPIGRDAPLTRRQRAALPGSSHDLVIGALKWLLPLLAFAVLLTIVVWPLAKAQEFSFLLAKDKVAMAQERLRVDNAVYRGETLKGEAFSIRAVGAVQKSSAVPIVELRGLKAQLAMADGPATVNAETGRYFLHEDRLEIAGPVELDAPHGYRIDSSQVDIDLGDRTVDSEGVVTGTSPLGNFRAGRLHTDIKGRTSVLDKGVHLHIKGRAGRAGR